MLIDLIDENRQQLSLMDTPKTEEERQRSQKLMATMDALNAKMGMGTVRLGLLEKNAPGTFAARTEARTIRRIRMN
ncbi:DUF4113 domain-containing protein [Vreelandella indica]|uniref:DUF4113 domain-containing protein n=1 Tax=Vreelandella indica TaxID=3126500 RepID=UPI00300E4470